MQNFMFVSGKGTDYGLGRDTQTKKVWFLLSNSSGLVEGDRGGTVHRRTKCGLHHRAVRSERLYSILKLRSVQSNCFLSILQVKTIARNLPEHSFWKIKMSFSKLQVGTCIGNRRDHRHTHCLWLGTVVPSLFLSECVSRSVVSDSLWPPGL